MVQYVSLSCQSGSLLTISVTAKTQTMLHSPASSESEVDDSHSLREWVCKNWLHADTHSHHAHSPGNFPAAALTSCKAPSIKKSASQLTQPRPSKTAIPPSNKPIFSRPISLYACIPPHNLHLKDNATIFTAQEPDVYIASYHRALSRITGIISDKSQLPNRPRVLGPTIGDHMVHY